MSILRVLLCCTVTTILNCSLSPLADNGTGTDIGEAKIYGSVKLPGNIPGEEVAVSLRHQDYIPFSVPLQNQQRTVSDKNGIFTLTQPEVGFYLIELIGKDSLCAIKRFYVSGNDDSLTLDDCTLDTPSVVSGNVFADDAPVSGADLLVLGLDNTTTTQNDGSFSLRLPPGEQLLRIIPKNGLGTSDILFSNRNTGDTIRSYPAPVTILDDFENRDGRNALTSLLGGGSWFSFTDAENGGNSIILPTGEPGLIAAIDSTSAAFKGGSLHCTFQIDRSFNAPFALIGVDFSNSKDANSSKSWFDLAKMTALTFMGKGSGTVYIQFTCKPVGPSADFTIYEIPVFLSSEWTKCTIRASDIPLAITSPSSEMITWGAGNSAVSNINFLAKDNTDLWLDDITIEGMNAADFLSPSKTVLLPIPER
jgi:hypothetical protein